jgi:glycosyltransferase involved in cell wall biosynthesis
MTVPIPAGAFQPPRMTFQVVIPSWNQARFVGAAVRSVLDQSADVDLELVIVDACSSDGTEAEVASALGTPHTARILVIREPDEGQSDAINKGMDRGTGEILGWLNADDVLLPGALASVGRFFAEAAPDIGAVYGDIHFLDDTDEVTGTFRGLRFNRSDLLWGPGYIPQPATFVRRSAWEAVGGVRRELHYTMDVDLWLRLSEEWQIEHLPEVLACFRRHENQKTVAAASAMRAEWRRVQQEHASRVLARRPSQLECLGRNAAVRASRKLRKAAHYLRTTR